MILFMRRKDLTADKRGKQRSEIDPNPKPGGSDGYGFITVTLLAAFSTASCENGKICGVPVRHASNSSL
jgi:hypothetical protein